MLLGTLKAYVDLPRFKEQSVLLVIFDAEKDVWKQINKVEYCKQTNFIYKERVELMFNSEQFTFSSHRKRKTVKSPR